MVVGETIVNKSIHSLDDDEKLVYTLHISGQDREIWIISDVNKSIHSLDDVEKGVTKVHTLWLEKHLTNIKSYAMKKM